jgi:hypothetical protein
VTQQPKSLHHACPKVSQATSGRGCHVSASTRHDALCSFTVTPIHQRQTRSWRPDGFPGGTSDPRRSTTLQAAMCSPLFSHARGWTSPHPVYHGGQRSAVGDPTAEAQSVPCVASLTRVQEHRETYAVDSVGRTVSSTRFHMHSLLATNGLAYPVAIAQGQGNAALCPWFPLSGLGV